MVNVPPIVGIRFKRSGQVHYFDPKGLDLQINDMVVVETETGEKTGTVVIAPDQVISSQILEPLSPVLRKASP